MPNWLSLIQILVVTHHGGKVAQLLRRPGGPGVQVGRAAADPIQPLAVVVFKGHLFGGLVQAPEGELQGLTELQVAAVDDEAEVGDLQVVDSVWNSGITKWPQAAKKVVSELYTAYFEHLVKTWKYKSGEFINYFL